jgi:hypothetical protein
MVHLTMDHGVSWCFGTSLAPIPPPITSSFRTRDGSSDLLQYGARRLGKRPDKGSYPTN